MSNATSVDASYNASLSLTGAILSATGRRLGLRFWFTECHTVCIEALVRLVVCVKAGMAWLAGKGWTGRTLLSRDLVSFGDVFFIFYFISSFLYAAKGDDNYEQIIISLWSHSHATTKPPLDIELAPIF